VGVADEVPADEIANPAGASLVNDVLELKAVALHVVDERHGYRLRPIDSVEAAFADPRGGRLLEYYYRYSCAALIKR
jgi:hypothetical protein